MVYIETDRLILRDWKENDLELFRALNADDKVMEYFPNTLAKEETDNFYHLIKQEIKDSGYGLYAAEVKATGEFIGLIGLHKATFEADFTPCIEVGWRLKKEAWGNGYATEGAKACIQYAFMELGVKEVYSFTATINHRSENVMKKAGMKYVKNFNHPKLPLEHRLCEHVLYHIRLTEQQ